MLKIAYICEPQMGGTYTSFRQVREGLISKGIDYRCIPPLDGGAFQSSRFAKDEGVDFLDFPDSNPAAMARRLVSHLQEQEYRAVVILPGCYPFVSSLPPYLPHEIRCIARMPHNARGVYWPTSVMADYFNRVIAVGPRLKSDLVCRYGVSEAKVEVLGNGVDIERCHPGEEASAHHAVYVGRIEDVQKNVFLLPRILSRALTHDADAFLTVVGSGPDSDSLRKRFSALGLDGHFKMLGHVEAREIPGILRQHGVFILPSRFEGCSNSTLEAMACGCVPIISRLPGISDELLVDGYSGFLFAPDDWRGMGDEWGKLVQSEAVWRRCSSAAHDQVASRFSLDRMAEKYAGLFQAVITEPDHRPDPESLVEFALNPRLGPTWRRWIPEGAKKRLRTWAARLGISP